MAVLEVFRIANGFDSLGNALSAGKRSLGQTEGEEEKNSFGRIFDQALFKEDSAGRGGEEGRK